jgi:CHASE2 domain-containing sensor protein
MRHFYRHWHLDEYLLVAVFLMFPLIPLLVLLLVVVAVVTDQKKTFQRYVR